MAIWKSSWNLFKQEIKEMFSVGAIIFTLTVSIISSTISYFTGYEYLVVVEFLMCSLLLAMIVWLSIALIYRKVKNKNKEDETDD